MTHGQWIEYCQHLLDQSFLITPDKYLTYLRASLQEHLIKDYHRRWGPQPIVSIERAGNSITEA